MKKIFFTLFAWFATFSIIFLGCNKLFAQEKDDLYIILENKKNEIKKIFLDNKDALITIETKNMLTDELCRGWIGDRNILKKTFVQIDECTGDSLNNIFYEDGLLIQEGSGDQLFFVGKFKTKSNVLYSGQDKLHVKEILGSPYKESDLLVVYKKALHPEIVFYEDKKFDESVILLFKNDKLIAIWVSFYIIC